MYEQRNLLQEEIAKIFKIEYAGGIRYKCPRCEEKVLIIASTGEYNCSGCSFKGSTFKELAIDLYGPGSEKWFQVQLEKIKNGQSAT